MSIVGLAGMNQLLVTLQGAEIHLDSPIQGMNKLESDDASLIYSIVEDFTGERKAENLL